MTRLLRKALLLLALLLSATAGVSAQPVAAVPSANRFDAVFAKVIGPESMDMTYEEYEAYLQQLRALLPQGDRKREVQFRSVYCTSEYWKDPKQGLAYADEAQRRAQAAGDLASQGRAQFCRIGYVQELEGAGRAIGEAERMVSLLEDSAESQLLGEALIQRGNSARSCCRYASYSS